MSDEARSQATIWLFNYLVARWWEGRSANIAINAFMASGIIDHDDGLVTADKAEFFQTRGVEEVVRLLDILIERGSAERTTWPTE
ncbi:MAG: hypothetical protein AB7R89_19845 [Dehalococcoidia bacterium]